MIFCLFVCFFKIFVDCLFIFNFKLFRVIEHVYTTLYPGNSQRPFIIRYVPMSCIDHFAIANYKDYNIVPQPAVATRRSTIFCKFIRIFFFF